MIEIDARLRTLLLALLTLGAVVLLSAGLPSLRLAPGYALPFRSDSSSPEEALEGRPLPGASVLASLFQLLFSVALLLFPVGLIYVLVNPKARKQLWRDLMLAVSFMLLYRLLGTRLYEVFSQFSPEGGMAGAPNGANPMPTPSELVTSPPDWVVLIISLSVALVLLATPIALFWFIRRQRKGEPVLRELAEEAGETLSALKQGADFRDTIIRCYARMSQILSQERQLERHAAMTPREFERRLRRIGLPQQPVQQLTHLFEAVRYGGQTPTPAQESQALSSLDAIVQACEGDA